MKKTFATLGVVAMSMVAQATPSHADRTLIFGTSFPPTSPTAAGRGEPWAKRVTELSNGKLTIQHVPGGSLVDTNAQVPALRDNAVDITTIINQNFTADLPVLALISDLYGLGGGHVASSGAINEFIMLNCPECGPELERNNIYYLGGQSVSYYSLMCTKALNSPKDYTGLRLRAPGPVGRLYSSIPGVTAINIAFSETFEALQRGALDCAAMPVETYKSFSFYEVAKNLVLTTTGNNVIGPTYGFNLDIWNDLSADEKRIIYTATADTLAQAAIYMKKGDQGSVDFARESGSNVIEMDPDAKRYIEEWHLKNIEESISRAEERGIENAREIVDRYIGITEKWAAIEGGLGDDVVKISETYRKEIFDKLPAN